MIKLIKNIIVGIFKAIYKVFSIFNLQFALLVALVGVVLYFCGVFNNGGLSLLVFCIVFIGSLLLAVFLTIKKIFGGGKPKSKKNQVQIIQQVEEQTPQQNVYNTTQSQVVSPNANFNNYQQVAPPIQTVAEQPVYYRVKQNSRYIMAEYSNRYELYQITPTGMKKIRTDYK